MARAHLCTGVNPDHLYESDKSRFVLSYEIHLSNTCDLWLNPAWPRRGSGPATGPVHPMVALTPEEIQLGVSLLRNAQLVDDKTQFADIRLRELPKAEVLAWTRGKSFGRPAGNPSGRMEPGARSQLKNPVWLKKMAEFGYKDPKSVNCTPIGVGDFPNSGFGKRRVLKVVCLDIENRLGFLQARPIDHIVTTVDADTGDVLKVITAKAPEEPLEIPGYGSKLAPRRKPLRPVVNIAPGGANFVLRGGIELEWQNWTFHLRTDQWGGLVISLANFLDEGKKRMVAYQIALSEMYVPYMDPAETWSFKTFLDAGEYGLGYLISTLAPGRDYPHNAVFVDALIPSDLGGIFRADKAICIFERNTGDPAWRHYQSGAQRNYSAPQVELVVRMAPTISNYDYIVDYVFQLRGSIKIRPGRSKDGIVRAGRQPHGTQGSEIQQSGCPLSRSLLLLPSGYGC